MDPVYALEPINKTASLIINQRGCTNGILTAEQYRENLVTKVKQLHKKIPSYPKNSRKRYLLNREMAAINTEIHRIRPKKKAPGVEQYFIKAAQKLLSKHQFSSIMSTAVQMLEEETK